MRGNKGRKGDGQARDEGGGQNFGGGGGGEGRGRDLDLHCFPDDMQCQV